MSVKEYRHKNATEPDKEIVFSKSIKAGKRIYYLDVKKNRKDEMFLSITESKKIISGEGEDSQVNFEKHKIFVYKEDFEKFISGLHEAIGYIIQEQGVTSQDTSQILEQAPITSSESEEIKIDIDF